MNIIKKALPPAVRANLGRSVRNLKRKPHDGLGRDFIAEVRSRLPKLEVKTIFDVGAWRGVTALEFADCFPLAAVYAFEPGAENFKEQEKTLAGKPAVRRHRLGFGEDERVVTLFMDPAHSSMGRITTAGSGPVESIKIDTMDHFCSAHSISSVDILKIDTEGHELPVLRGASGLLKSSRIGVLKAEVAVDPDMDYHTQFFDLVALLNPFGYRLFGIYDQCENGFSPGPRLRRFDAAFIGPAVISQHMSTWRATPP